MELHELAIAEARTGPEAQRMAVTAGAGRVRGLAVDLAGAARRDDHGASFDGEFEVVLQRDGTFAAAVVHDEIPHEHLRAHGDARMVADRSRQRTLDLEARRVVVGMDDARMAVATFAR